MLGVLLMPLNWLVNPNYRDLSIVPGYDFIMEIWDSLVWAFDALGVLEREHCLSLQKKWGYQVPYTSSYKGVRAYP
jgi:hypothetical protein